MVAWRGLLARFVKAPTEALFHSITQRWVRLRGVLGGTLRGARPGLAEHKQTDSADQEQQTDDHGNPINYGTTYDWQVNWVSNGYIPKKDWSLSWYLYGSQGTDYYYQFKATPMLQDVANLAPAHDGIAAEQPDFTYIKIVP